jgi:Predicted GTPase, probable translation factor
MRTCIIGLPSSGKTTIFKALTGEIDQQAYDAVLERAVEVPDERVGTLSKLYNPKKTTYAKIEFVDLAGNSGMGHDAQELGAKFLNAVRPASVLIHGIDAFSCAAEGIDKNVAEAVDTIDTELVFSDLQVCERRIERMKKEGPKVGAQAEELRLVSEAAAKLSQGTPLRICPMLANASELRVFTFLSAKPIITIVNTSEDRPTWTAERLPEKIRNHRQGAWGRWVALCGKLEAEIAGLPHEEAKAFLADYGIITPARERVIQVTYELLGLMSFFTVGEDEVRAWTIRNGQTAEEAAGVIHSDIQRGFIRAEVVDYADAVACGSFEEAKKVGKMHLEGKQYLMKNGDIVSFRFNV